MPDLPGTAIYRARVAESIDAALYLLLDHLRESLEVGVNPRIEVEQLREELQGQRGWRKHRTARGHAQPTETARDGCPITRLL